MSNLYTERVLSVHHWNDTLFSFKTTRNPGLRFKTGQFVMIGLEVDGRPLMRAYSIASPNYEEHLEFFSIKVPDGPLTSRLQHLKEGDELMVSRKPTGTLVHDDLLPGKHLYLLSTGTGMAPFLSVIQDPETYERYEKVILVHGVRWVSELAYADFITKVLPEHEYFGDQVKEKLIYYPLVTREPFRNQGRQTDLMRSGKLFEDIGLPPMNPQDDRAMICGSPSMLEETSAVLDSFGLKISPRMGEPGDYLIERAFVESRPPPRLVAPGEESPCRIRGRGFLSGPLSAPGAGAGGRRPRLAAPPGRSRRSVVPGRLPRPPGASRPLRRRTRQGGTHAARPLDADHVVGAGGVDQAGVVGVPPVGLAHVVDIQARLALAVFRLQPPAEQFGGGAELAHRAGKHRLALGTGHFLDEHAADVAFVAAGDRHRAECRGVVPRRIAAGQQQAEQERAEQRAQGRV